MSHILIGNRRFTKQSEEPQKNGISLQNSMVLGNPGLQVLKGPGFSLIGSFLSSSMIGWFLMSSVREFFLWSSVRGSSLKSSMIRSSSEPWVPGPFQDFQASFCGNALTTYSDIAQDENKRYISEYFVALYANVG